MLIKKLFLSFSILILFASVVSCASETSTEPKEGVINIAIETALGTKVGKGETLQLTVTIATMEGVSEDVEWSSEDENIATVDTNGLVTGVVLVLGTVMITVTSTADNSKTASVSIEVVEEVISITISTNSIAINPNSVTKVGRGEKLQLGVNIETKGASEDVVWSSADESIATVDTNGLVTGVGLGTVMITVTSTADSSKTASVEISVVEEVISITISTNSIAINTNSVTKVGRGEKLQLGVNIETKGGVSEDVVWSSANENIATVDTNGLVTGVGLGTVMITVTSTADNSKTASVSIEVVEEVISITISTNSIAINTNSVTKVGRGEELQLGVNIETKGGASEEVVWSSADESIATVNTNGLVTGVALGTVMITVTSTADSSKRASVSIEVVEEVVSITITTDSGTKVVKEKDLQLGVNIETKGGASEDVVWSSADESIATVDINGLVTGVALGTVSITVTSTADNSKTASVSIEVVPAVGEVWNQVTPSGGHFSARVNHQAFLGENGKRLWVMGGYDGSKKNDIWYSDNEGVNWTKVTPSGGHFSARFRHQAFLGENGRLWVIGGYDGSYKNDIWYSDNEGVNWTKVTVMGTQFLAREFHQAFLGKNGRLWVIGGETGSRENDIWYSDNEGVNWTKVTPSGGHFSARVGHQAFLGEGGRLWVIGGSDRSGYLNDIWYSDNEGVNWRKASSGHFSGRAYHQVFLGKDGKRLWVIGGYDGSYKNDIWYSDDEGATWNQVMVMGMQFSARSFHQAFLGDNGRLWVIGGYDGSRKNDIWYSD